MRLPYLTETGWAVVLAIACGLMMLSWWKW
jgi:hypothetical protein